MKLFELVGREKDNGFSPFAWRVKLALAHKGLDYETVPLHFTEIKETLEFADSKTVPVLVDGDNVIKDSWDICCYLEDTYQDGPSLFGDRDAARLFSFQIAGSLLAPLFRTIVADIFNVIDDKDVDHFRSTREPRIGCTIEEAAKDFEQSFSTFKAGLWPYNQFLKEVNFLCGDSPAFNDFVLYGMFLWARATSDKNLIENDDPLSAWLYRMDQQFDGLGGKVTKIK